MELVFSELLSREDILRILHSRCLQICDIDKMSDAELMRVYRMFVLPLSQRHPRNRGIELQRNLLDSKMNTDFHESGVLLMDVDETPVVVGGRLNLNHISEKRRSELYDEIEIVKDDYQYQLSSATKRIKISLS
uniref:Ashwin n=1 Tax=Glossina brevipalpis TaxID=37001 RepID=A0A1A9W787_9MUSC